MPSVSSLTSIDLTAIARAGGCLDIDAASFTSLDLTAVARALTPHAHMTVRGTQRLTSIDMVAFARAAPGKITFAD